ncbi:hypothetical protein ABE354_08715 [Brevibacillus laterosporus]|uniref:hypothetical protein n=1 Tax=Brevibacillus laterosporus TaxID=1465 RepID=UPI003D210DC5
MLAIRQHKLHRFSLVTTRDRAERLLGLCNDKNTLIDMSTYLRTLNPTGYPEMWIVNNRTGRKIVTGL